MAEKVEDFNLPHSVVQKIIKEALPENVSLGKDVKNAMAKAAAMFILYITSHSTQLAQKYNRKTLVAQDIFDALHETEFSEMIEPLKASLAEYKSSKQKIEGSQEKLAETIDDEDIEESETMNSADSDE